VELNDLPGAREEALSDSEFGEHFDRALVGERDERILSVLSELVRTRSAERIDVAIVYGAGHVPGIVRVLMTRHGYRPQAAEWLTVVSA
jgi:pheromone shutdown protein TraB